MMRDGIALRKVERMLAECPQGVVGLMGPEIELRIFYGGSCIVDGVALHSYIRLFFHICRFRVTFVRLLQSGAFSLVVNQLFAKCAFARLRACVV